MSKNIHTATLPSGEIAKRTSAGRTYPFCVAVGPAPRAERISVLESRIAYAESLVRSYRAVIEYVEAGGRIEHETRSFSDGYSVVLVDLGGDIRDRRVGFKGYLETPEEILTAYKGYVDSQVEAIAAAATKLEEEKTGPDFTEGWHVSGWQSRADLAQKELARVAAGMPLREVRILETTIVSK